MRIQYFYKEKIVSGISSSGKFLYDDLDAPFVWNALENSGYFNLSKESKVYACLL